MAKKAEHTFVENTSTGGYRCFCTRCGDDLIIEPPLRMDLFLGIVKLFGKTHRDCKKREEPANSPE